MSTLKTTISQQWNGTEIKIQGQKVVNKTAYEIGLVVEGQAKLLCPIDLGYLAASINVQSVDQGTELGAVKPNPERKRLTKSVRQKSFWEDMPENFHKIDKPTDANEVLIGTAVEYGPYIEFGTVNMDSQPFLRPALDLAKGRTLTILEANGKKYFGDFLRRPV